MSYLYVMKVKSTKICIHLYTEIVLNINVFMKVKFIYLENEFDIFVIQCSVFDWVLLVPYSVFAYSIKAISI